MAYTFLLPPSLGSAKASARADLLRRAMKSELGEDVDVLVAESYADVRDRAIAGEAELVWAPAGVAAHLEPRARAVFKVVRYRTTSARSAIVARKEDRLSMGRLAGKRAAWVDPLSVGGYLLARAHLARLGIDPVRTFAKQTFMGSHPEALMTVLTGNADVAAVTVAGDDLPRAREALALYIGPTNAEKIDVLDVTADAPTDAVVITGRTSELRAERLVKALTRPFDDARPPSRMLSIMEAEALVRARPGEFQALLALFG